jgi:hypothetical protein
MRPLKTRNTFGRWSWVASVIVVVGWIVYWELVIGPETDLVIPSWFSKTVASRSVFVLRRGAACGAFQIIEQGHLGERGHEREEIAYAWRYREDGGNQLAPGPGVHSGEGRGPRVLFGPFRLEWSAADFGSGYLYYNRKHDQPIEPDDVRVAVTKLDTLDGISCDDSRWTFRAASNDAAKR